MVVSPRPGEQTLPVEGKQDCSWAAQKFIRSIVPALVLEEDAETICEALERRIVDYGFKKYGIRLQTHNGRDMLRDVDEEVLDAINYQQGDVLENPEDGLSRSILWKLIDIALCIHELKQQRKSRGSSGFAVTN